MQMAVPVLTDSRRERGGSDVVCHSPHGHRKAHLYTSNSWLSVTVTNTVKQIDLSRGKVYLFGSFGGMSP